MPIAMRNVEKDQKTANALPVNGGETVRLEELDPIEARKIQNTQQAALPAIQNTDLPSSSDASLNGRAALGAPTPMQIDSPEPTDIDSTAPGEIAWKAVSEFPALAWESVKTGLAKEEAANGQLNGYIQEAEGHQKTIDLLLQLSAKLTSLPDKGSHDLSPDTKKLLEELKQKGVDLNLDPNAKISSDKIPQVKSLLNSFIDQKRSKLQILFSTKIQVAIQNISSIMEALKNIVKDNTRLISTIVGHSGGR